MFKIQKNTIAIDLVRLNSWKLRSLSRAGLRFKSSTEYYDGSLSDRGEQSKSHKENKLHAPEILAFIGLSFLTAGTSPAFADTSSLSQQVAAIVQPQLDQYPDASIGVAVGVVEPGTSGAITTSIFYFGKITDENNNPMLLNGATEFEIGSVTKTFTATVLASQLQEQPWLLNTPINQIFRRTPTFNGQQIMIRDLADYTSGLPDSNRDGGSASCTFSGATINDCYDLSLMFQNLSNPALSALQFAPGTAYLYSDLAVALLALAEPVLGGSQTTIPLQLLNEWEVLVDSIVLQPLRMKLTHAFDPALDPPLLPQGFNENSSGQITPALNHNTSWPAFIGAGGLVSTPNDMMIYLEYNLGLLETSLNNLLPPLHTPATTVTTGSGEQLALGWFLGTIPGSTIPSIAKNGGVPGFNTQVLFAPSTSTGVFVLVNTSGIVDVRTIASQVLQIINGLSPTAASPSNDQP
jgi:serine-type D-Ala-D-Ala carboxypeptidase/endopeptidase